MTTPEKTSKPKSKTLGRRIKAAINWPSKAAVRKLESVMGKGSLVGDKPVFDNRDFPWAGQLEANAHIIREELANVIELRDALPTMQYISKTQKKIIKTDGWKTYFFTAFGERADRNCERCPQTAALLDKIPDLEAAFFSILAPGSHIRAHRGVYKGLVRAHLGLVVPEPSKDCRMAVGDEMVYWKEGECVVFDDTYQHEVWNDTDGVRVVLLIDVHRPLPPALDRLNKALLRMARMMPFVREPVRQHRAWEKEFYANA
ncbi:aspartyl beta-hydroxylase [Acuticoccus sediminis]|uniref:Aspartyl beta-hydroxylase n=2 Tax=Acuticoccus sediminis TaxID=2184697 RepID=A0A8B2NW48_9HYPH|nr:aspartyl beta-hydroxylase [Acuticoccus sediminis]